MWRIDRTRLCLQSHLFRPYGSGAGPLRISGPQKMGLRAQNFSSGNIWDDIHVEQLQQQQQQHQPQGTQQPFPQDPFWGADYSTTEGSQEGGGDFWAGDNHSATHSGSRPNHENPAVSTRNIHPGTSAAG